MARIGVVATLLLLVEAAIAGGLVPCPLPVYGPVAPVVIPVGPPIRLRPAAIEELQRVAPPSVREPKLASREERTAPPSVREPMLASREERAAPLTPEYAVYPVPGRDPAVPPGPVTRVRVGWWNQTERTVELLIDGQSHRIPPRQSLKLTVPGTFRWNEVGQPSRTESVPADAVGLEIVIRR